MQSSGRIPLTNTPSVQEAAEIPTSKSDPVRTSEEKTEVQVPYTDYEHEVGHPYLVDHFNLGDTWDDPQGGFPNEVKLIQTYIDEKVKSGEVANSVTAIKNILKDMEKFNNLKGEERSVVKLEVLAHYVEFMMKNDKTRANLRRYNGQA